MKLLLLSRRMLIVIIWLMLSVSICTKVIPFSGYHYTYKNYWFIASIILLNFVKIFWKLTGVMVQNSFSKDFYKANESSQMLSTLVWNKSLKIWTPYSWILTNPDLQTRKSGFVRIILKDSVRGLVLEFCFQIGNDCSLNTFRLILRPECWNCSIK